MRAVGRGNARYGQRLPHLVRRSRRIVLEQFGGGKIKRAVFIGRFGVGDGNRSVVDFRFSAGL